MTNDNCLKTITDGIKNGSVVPYLGPGVLQEVKAITGDERLPADSDSLILAMNNGQPMAPRLMYEFPRAAMNMELKKGRSYVERFLTETYRDKKWQRSKLHNWLAEMKPAYVIDINRDVQLQESYQDTHHILVVGTARIAGTDYRYKLYRYNGTKYDPIRLEEVESHLPVLFKPMGTPVPEPSYIAADADYVDYITELMGGFAIPAFLKNYRKGKKYLLLGMRFLRDTERMVVSDIVYGAGEPAGWALILNPTEKERRFCAVRNIEILEDDWPSLVNTATGSDSVVRSAVEIL